MGVSNALETKLDRFNSEGGEIEKKKKKEGRKEGRKEGGGEGFRGELR